MIVSYSKNFIFIHLEKCGGTSIEQAIKPYLGQQDIQIGGLNTLPDEKELKYLTKYNFGNHATANDLKKYFKKEWETMYKFATIRNPQDMLISLYYYIENHFKDRPNDPFFKLYHDSLNNEYPLDDFINNVLKNPFRSTTTFSSRLDNSVELFDIDYIDNDWNYILEKINIKENVKLNKLNKSVKPNNIVLQQSTIDLIHDFFKIDYETIPQLNKYK